MRLATAVILVSSLVWGISGCKRSTPQEAEPTEAAAKDNGGNEAAPDDAGAPEATNEEPGKITEDVNAVSIPKDWNTIAVTTPKGTTLTVGVPGAWVELPPQNDATLFEWGAPEGEPEAGARISAVSLPFDGDLEALAEYNRSRLSRFAKIHEDGQVRMGNSDAYEVVASWETAMGSRDTVQLLLVAGQEGIGFNCLMAEGQRAELRQLCDEIFATHTIETAK